MKNKQGIITFSESMKKVKERFFDKKHENDRFREIVFFMLKIWLFP